MALAAASIAYREQHKVNSNNLEAGSHRQGLEIQDDRKARQDVFHIKLVIVNAQEDPDQ